MRPLQRESSPKPKWDMKGSLRQPCGTATCYRVLVWTYTKCAFSVRITELTVSLWELSLPPLAEWYWYPDHRASDKRTFREGWIYTSSKVVGHLASGCQEDAAFWRQKLMLSRWVWCSFCKEQAGGLLSSHKTMRSGQHSLGFRHSSECLWGRKQASKGLESSLIHKHTPDTCTYAPLSGM